MKNNRYFIKSGQVCILAALLVLTGCASKTPAPVYDRGGQQATASAGAASSRDSYTVKPGDTLLSIAREHGMDHRELAAMNGIDNPNRISVGRVLKVRPQTAAVSSAVVTAPVTSDVVVARPIGSEAVVERAPVASAGSSLKREPKAGKETYSDQALAQAQGAAQAKSSEAPVPASAPAVTPEVKAESKPADAAAGSEEVAWAWPASGKIIGTFSEGGGKGVDIAGRTGDAVNAAGEGKVVYTGTGLRGYGNLVIIKHNNTYLSAYAHNQKILVKEGASVSKGQKIAEMGNSDADQVKLHFEIRRQNKPVDPLKYLPQR